VTIENFAEICLENSGVCLLSVQSLSDLEPDFVLVE
jgi:hypothetical protein